MLASSHPASEPLGDRIAQIKQTLPASVRLIAVTKHVSVAQMREAYQAGIRDFGENRVQEAVAKRQQLADLSDLNWHLIGHLQTNKAAVALETFDWFHSVDSLKLAHRLHQLATYLPRKPNLLLQVKCLPDPNKFGWSIPDLIQDLPALADYNYLSIQGLMTILPLGLDRQQQLATFQQIQQLATQIRQQNLLSSPLTELSMGMSQDYLLAIQAGATMIRLGRIIFGNPVERFPD